MQYYYSCLDHGIQFLRIMRKFMNRYLIHKKICGVKLPKVTLYTLACQVSTNESCHEKIQLFMLNANNKGTDQPAHPHSLISAFVGHCLDSIIPLVSISQISNLYLASVAAQTGLCFTWSQPRRQVFSWRGSNMSRLLRKGTFELSSVTDPSTVYSRARSLALLLKLPHTIIWASSWENVSSGVSDQFRLKLTCSATRASMRLEISDIETGHITLSKQRTIKALIILHRCADWSAPLLFAYDIRHVFSWPGSYILYTNSEGSGASLCKCVGSITWAFAVCLSEKYPFFMYPLISSLHFKLLINNNLSNCRWCHKRINDLLSLRKHMSTKWVYEPRHEKTCLCHVRTTKAQISLRRCTVWLAPLLFAA